MNPVEKYIFEKAMAHYGPEAQIKMLYEEMAELQLAVCKMAAALTTWTTLPRRSRTLASCSTRCACCLTWGLCLR